MLRLEVDKGMNFTIQSSNQVIHDCYTVIKCITYTFFIYLFFFTTDTLKNLICRNGFGVQWTPLALINHVNVTPTEMSNLVLSEAF